MASRIIITGKNSEMPRTVRLPLGVAVDGTVFSKAVRIAPNEVLCPDCRGWGNIECSDGNPSTKSWDERCERCEGSGISTVEVQ